MTSSDYYNSQEPLSEFDSPFLNETFFTDDAAARASQARKLRHSTFNKVESPFLDESELWQEAMVELEVEDNLYEDSHDEAEFAEEFEEEDTTKFGEEEEDFEPEVAWERFISEFEQEKFTSKTNFDNSVDFSGELDEDTEFEEGEPFLETDEELEDIKFSSEEAEYLFSSPEINNTNNTSSFDSESFELEEEYEYSDESEIESEWLDEFEVEVESEINRRSKSYIRWIQQQLNRVESAGLDTDGIIGPSTRRAIRNFQKKYSVVNPPDGKPSQVLDSFLIMFGAPPPPGSPEPKRFDPSSLPPSVYAAFKRGSSAWKVVLQRALDSGITSADKLADIVFFSKHPERKGRQINSSETKAIREWNTLRDEIKKVLKARKVAKTRVYPSYVPQKMIAWLESPVQGVMTRRFRATHPKFSFLVAWKAEKPEYGCSSSGGFADRSWFAAGRDDFSFWNSRLQNDRVARIVADAKQTYNEKVAWYMEKRKFCANKARIAVRNDDKKWLLKLIEFTYSAIPSSHNEKALKSLVDVVDNSSRLVQWVKDRLKEKREIEPIYVEHFLDELNEGEIYESAWRMRPPVRYQANRYICWAEAISSWSMVTRGVQKFKSGQDVIEFFKPLGVVNPNDSLKLPKGMEKIQSFFDLKFKKLEQGDNFSAINWAPMLRHNHLIVIFQRPGATYFHFVVVYGVDRFHICFMDPELNPGSSSLDKVKRNRVCARLENFGAGADKFWVFWK